MSFKLLAIRPLKGCLDNIRKNLKEEEFYFFDNSYERYKDSDFIVRKKDAKDLPKDFFLQKNTESSLEYINVQAIVGKNGSGKSAIAELLLATLNNLFEYISNRIKNDIELIKVNELKVSLYFQIDRERYIIINVYSDKIDGFIVDEGSEVDENLKLYNFLNHLDIDSNSEKLFQFLKNIFFTMYINYSLYGLDEIDFLNQGKGGDIDGNIISWLGKIFHKNDGYQAPLVIHPYRENATINVRNEKSLMNQRLSSLLFSNPEYKDIIPGYSFTKIMFSLRDFSFYKGVLKRYYSSRKIVGEIRIKEKPNNKILFFLNKDYKSLKLVLDEFKILIKEDKSAVNNDNEKDLSLFNYLFSLYLKEINANFKSISEKLIILDSKGKILNEFDSKEQLVQVVGKEIFKQKKYQKYKKRYDYFKWFGVDFVRKVSLLLLAEVSWKEYFDSKEIAFEEDLKKNSTIENSLFWYCVSKSVSILKYKSYSRYKNDIIREDILFENISSSDNCNKDLFPKEYISELIEEDSSHITLKLRQCFELINLCINPIEGEVVDSGGEKIYFSSSEFIDVYREIYKNQVNNYSIDSFGLLLKNTASLFKKDKKYDEGILLPPPIFEYDFVSGDEEISLSKVSSGQFQKIGMLSSIVYHLKNLDSVREAEGIYSYENVNLILDEIELYFHPEQQRTFVNELLGLLRENKFKQIKRINIMFITHSPFILSDIPSQNVLKLKDGKPVEGDSINSFGANIHDLLADEFFLNEDGFMGAFAKEKVNECIALLNWKVNYEEIIAFVEKDIVEEFIDVKLVEKYHDSIKQLKSDLIVLLDQKECIKVIKKFITEFCVNEKVSDENKIAILKEVLNKEVRLKELLFEKELICEHSEIKSINAKEGDMNEYIIQNSQNIRKIISLIGEPLVKNQLLDLFKMAFKQVEIESWTLGELEAQEREIKKRIEELKKKSNV